MRGTVSAACLLRTWLPGLALVALAVLPETAARAEADGPDFLRVTGVAEGSMLKIRSGPGRDHPAIGSLPFDAVGIRNLGCEGGFTFSEWQAATPEEREAARKRRWCRIEHGGTVGWAAGWYLGEGSAPAAASSSGPATTADAASAMAPELLDVRWRLLFAPTGAAVGEAWIEFAEDGAMHGKLGCNSFRGTAEVVGDAIRTAPLATTRMLCPEPGADAQEQAMAAVLAEPVQWQLEDGQLMLISADRTQELLFVSD